MTHVAVIDVGKTNAKLALVDSDAMREIAVVTRPNTVRPLPPWPHFDLDGHWQFFLDGLAAFHKAHGVDAISVTTHGAAAVLLTEDGSLAAPMLDYEHSGPDQTAKAYDALRPGFDETGSPRLPGGLNLGAQLHWQFETDPTLRARTRHILTYPQYWGYRLTGALASDVTSLGCHTDLWNPNAGQPSSLVERLGIGGKLAPARPCGDTLGTLLPEIAQRTGLPVTTPVAVGIHDSNASLLPYLLDRRQPFSVVSTGTWIIAMSVGGKDVTLDPARDTLVNVDAFGNPVRSARFMGGREFELLSGPSQRPAEEADLAELVARDVMFLPSAVPSSGPFAGRSGHWVGREPAFGSPLRAAAISAYVALVTAQSLRLVGHAGRAIIEGPFARNGAFLAVLHAATGRPVEAAQSATGTSEGAARLVLSKSVATGATPTLDVGRRTEALTRYCRQWAERLAAPSPP